MLLAVTLSHLIEILDCENIKINFFANKPNLQWIWIIKVIKK